MHTESHSLIRLDDIQKVFYTDEVETHALSEIHLEVKRGEYVAIAGPSGCGKTTLLSILGLLDAPSGGRYWLNQTPVEGLSPAERARIRNREIGFIFQAFNLIGDLTVYENVELPLTYRGLGGAERKKRVQEALERVGMAHRIPALSRAALGRPAAARGGRPRRGGPAADSPGRRADRQSRLQQRRSGDAAAPGAAPRARPSAW